MISYELGKPPGQQALLAALAETPARLDLAACAIGTLEVPATDVSHVLGQLDALAAEVREVAKGSTVPDALTKVLAFTHELRGDTEEYHSPLNSCLPRVLERKKGLPILLSVVWIEVARRAGFELHGIGLPGHFVVGFEDDGDLELRDPFNGGAALTRADAERSLQRFAPGARLTASLLAPMTVKAICWRMLTNLKGAYLDLKDWAKALETVDLLLTLEPAQPRELRTRAQLLTEMGAFSAALADVETCLAQADVDDEESLERAAAMLRERIGALH